MRQEKDQAALELVRMWGEYHYGRDGTSSGPRGFSAPMPSGDLELDWQRDLRVAAQVVDRALGQFETFQRARVSRLLKWVGYLGEPIEGFRLFETVHPEDIGHELRERELARQALGVDRMLGDVERQRRARLLALLEEALDRVLDARQENAKKVPEGVDSRQRGLG